MPTRHSIKKASRKSEPESPQAESTHRKSFPVVGMGASAGGLEAFENFFKVTPDNTGAAFILVVHLDPGHVSLLPELIQKKTAMTVCQIKDGLSITPNHIYVIPPNHNLSINNEVLHLTEITKPRGANLPIDSFFHSLAEDQGSHAIGIILSGTGSDGTSGLKAIKAENGLVMVQQESSAKYDGMPRSAINTGLADYILPAEQLPAQLIKYIQFLLQDRPGKPVGNNVLLSGALTRIYAILFAQTNQDFSLYKKNTICRRIERRMNVHQIEHIHEYVEYLEKSEREVEILFQELLIGVTSFFRDPAAFDVLKNTYLPELLKNKPKNYTVRIWVSACSTGEEAYSLAILLQEYIVSHKTNFNVQIFGTDIDENAINTARLGLYAESIKAHVSAERLQKFFIKEDNNQYRIKKTIREMLVFAPQNIIKDPPFTKLDIISCRNLQIYFEPELQRKLLPIFHYSLIPDGLLLLGSSESIGPFVDLYAVLDKKWKLFRKQSTELTTRPFLEFPISSIEENNRFPHMSDSIRRVEEISALQLVETILQQSDTAPCAIIDDNNNVVYIHGRTGHFLEPAEGKVSVNILDMARSGLKPALSSAIRKVAMYKQEVVIRDVTIVRDQRQFMLDITLRPIMDQSVMRGLIMVIFEEKNKPLKNEISGSKEVDMKKQTRSPREIERELLDARENLQTTIEELEASNEELKSTNEELQSTNEELQTTNEEMETSKEELQSLNEESTTVNAELQSRIEELSKSNDDMKNLLDSTDIATIFLDTSFCIRRFTPRVMDIIPLTATDMGRPISHFATTLINTDISQLGIQVLQDLIPLEVETHTHDGLSYTMKIRPYRTMNNAIDGLVVTFEDITDRKQSEFAVQESEARYKMLFELASDSVVLIDAKTGLITECNKNAANQLGYTRPQFLNLTVSDIENIESKDSITKHTQAILEKGSDSFSCQLLCKNSEVKKVKVKAKAIIFKEKKYLISTWLSEN